MRIRIIWIVCVLGIRLGFSQALYDRLAAEQSMGIIDESRALFIKGLKSFAPDHLPEPYRDLPDLPLKSATGLLAEIRLNWDRFNLEQQAVLEPLLYRPRLQKSHVTPSGLFRVHYDTSGTNAVSLDDFDQSGVPDYVEETAGSLEYAYSVEIGQLGFKVPPDDNNEDGPEWDVYIKAISDYGYTSFDPDPDQPGVYITYITMDNNYAHTPTQGIDGARVTVAHEFFHMIQFGYYFRYNDIFLMEAGATWMEDVVYDYVNDYYFYLSNFFERTNISFNVADGWREYGLCVWFHFLEKRLGGRDIVRLTWEEIVRAPAVRALDRALNGLGHTFEEELALFYGWNYMTGSRADTDLFYPEGDFYPEITLDESFLFMRDTTFTANIVSLAARYYHIETDEGEAFTIIPMNPYTNPELSSDQCAVELIQGEQNPYYTDLGHGMLVRILSEDDKAWRAVAVTEAPGEETAIISFMESDETFTGSIAGRVWEDVDTDGILDGPDEVGLADISLSLTEAGADSMLGTSDDVPFSAKRA